MLKMSRSFAIRMTLWSVLILYLACDLFLFKGPLQQELREMFQSAEERRIRDIERGICARVWNQPIYLSQIERRMEEKLWRTGRLLDEISVQEKQLLLWASLDELINESLLRIKVRVNREEVPVSDTAIDAEVTRFEKRFTSADQLDEALKAQGIENRKELRFRLAARIQQEKYINQKIAEAIEVTAEEAQQWYEDHKEELTMTERREIRHIFLSTLDNPSDQAQATLEEHLAQLKNHQTNFIKLAAEVSEDESNKHKGGNLGWMKKDRLPKDFANAAFSLAMNKPTLIQTKLGWHIIEVIAIEPPKLLPYEDLKDEIITSLSDSKRKDAVRQYQHQLRLLNKDKIEIYRSMLK